MWGVTHEAWIMALSILVAIQGCYVALGLALKVPSTSGMRRRLNLAAAAFSFAISIWSMHFVGMLALRLPFRLDYLVLPTLLSFLLCVFVVGAAVFVASYALVWRHAIGLAALIMGSGIAVMHFIGMLALHHSAMMSHDPRFVAASFAVAIVAAFLGLRFAFLPRRRLPVALAAVLLGLAISGMHYVAMAGVTMMPFATRDASPAAVSSDLLAVVVTLIAFAVSAVFLLTLVPDHGPRPPPVIVQEVVPQPAPAARPSLEEPSAIVGASGQTMLSDDDIPPVVIGPPSRPLACTLPVERGNDTHHLRIDSIVLVQANAHYTYVFDGTARSFCPLSITEVESRLDPDRFLRVHRSYIVAVNRIAELRRDGDGGAVQMDTADAVSVPVSRARYPGLKARMAARV